MSRLLIDTREISLLTKRLEAANKEVKPAVDKALKASKQYVTNLLDKDTVRSNFPASGKYSIGKLKESIDRNYHVEWYGSKAQIKIGYDFNKSGLTSILMIRGAPRKQPPMAKARKIKDDIYGSKTEREVIRIQEETIFKIIARG